MYCCNFMEQIYQWFEYRKSNWWSFSLYLIKLSLKMIGWKGQEPETELCINHLNFQLPVLKFVATFLIWAKTNSFNISHFSRSVDLVRHKDLRKKGLSFLCWTFLKVRESWQSIHPIDQFACLEHTLTLVGHVFSERSKF